MNQRTTLEIIAPTVEEAIAQGLAELGLTADAVSVEVLDAGTKGFRLALVPAPGRVLILMVGIRTMNVRRAVLPGNPERFEHFRLLALHCSLDRLRWDVAL